MDSLKLIKTRHHSNAYRLIVPSHHTQSYEDYNSMLYHFYVPNLSADQSNEAIGWSPNTAWFSNSIDPTTPIGILSWGLGIDRWLGYEYLYKLSEPDPDDVMKTSRFWGKWRTFQIVVAFGAYTTKLKQNTKCNQKILKGSLFGNAKLSKLI